MTRARSLLIAASGFTQALAAGTVSAQNTFHDDLCQVSFDDFASCIDVGCQSQGGRCTPTQGLSPNGREVQGCVCIGPQHPQHECQQVTDRDTQQPFCVDLLCPPLGTYSCDAACNCPGPNEVGDDLCQPGQLDPTQCDDLGCAAQGGICMRTSALFPDGQYHQVCHCEQPPQSGPIGGCAVVFHHDTPNVRFCADFDCGNTDLYECNPALANCSCTCDTATPLEVSGLRWSSKVQFFWNHQPCATVYDVYRQIGPLTNCGGVACSYGPCLWSGLVAANATDVVVPPAGGIQYYLVSAESYVNEGTLGNSSAGLLRPNPVALKCSTPPPSP